MPRSSLQHAIPPRVGWGNDASAANGRAWVYRPSGQNVVLGARAFIGSGSVIVAPSEVGDDAMTGAGAIVKRGSKVGAREVWVGVPAKLLKQRELPPAKPATKDTAKPTTKDTAKAAAKEKP